MLIESKKNEDEIRSIIEERVATIKSMDIITTKAFADYDAVKVFLDAILNR